jgi:hypothetical protein
MMNASLPVSANPDGGGASACHRHGRSDSDLSEIIAMMGSASFKAVILKAEGNLTRSTSLSPQWPRALEARRA